MLVVKENQSSFSLLPRETKDERAGAFNNKKVGELASLPFFPRVSLRVVRAESVLFCVFAFFLFLSWSARLTV